MDNRGDLIWTCEAFGIPDVNYIWLKNGLILNELTIPEEDRGRYLIRDNILRIKLLEPRDEGMYQCGAMNHLKVRYSSGQLRVLCKLHFFPNLRN